MANLDAKRGFAPNVSQAGGTPARMREYNIASALGEDIFSGDLVSLAGTDRTINLTPATGADVARVLGVFAGCQYVAANGDVVWSPYWPTGTVTLNSDNAKAYVYDDPMLEFTAQISTVAITDFGQAFGWAVGTGNVTNGISGAQIDQASATAANTVARVEGFFEGPDGIKLAEACVYAKVSCTLTNHYFAATLTEV